MPVSPPSSPCGSQRRASSRQGPRRGDPAVVRRRTRRGGSVQDRSTIGVPPPGIVMSALSTALRLMLMLQTGPTPRSLSSVVAEQFSHPIGRKSSSIGAGSPRLGVAGVDRADVDHAALVGADADRPVALGDLDVEAQLALVGDLAQARAHRAASAPSAARGDVLDADLEADRRPARPAGSRRRGSRSSAPSSRSSPGSRARGRRSCRRRR